MSITITSLVGTADTVAVYYKPHWLRWLLFGATERWFHAVRSPWHRNGFVWLDGATGRRITHRALLKALDAHRAKRVAAIDARDARDRDARDRVITNVRGSVRR